MSALETHGVERSFEILPNSRLVYHCYFDLDGPPATELEASVNYTYHHSSGEVFLLDLGERTPYLEGLEVEGRLVAVLSKKGFSGPGAFSREEDARLGINMIVFALTQEGSLTRRLTQGIRGLCRRAIADGRKMQWIARSMHDTG